MVISAPEYGSTARRFEALNSGDVSFIITNVNEGIAKVIPDNCNDFYSFIKTLVGCLEEKSIFYLIFGYYYKAENLKGFEINWEGFDYLITPSTNEETVKKAFFRHNALQQKMEYRRHQVHKKVIEIDATTEIQFKDEEAEKRWKQIVANSENEFGLKAVAFTRKYAKMMQYLISRNGIDNFKNMSASIMTAIPNDGVVQKNIVRFTFYVLTTIWLYGKDF